MIITEGTKSLIGKAVEQLKDYIQNSDLLKKVKVAYLPILQELLKNFMNETEIDIFGEEVTTLTIEQLVNIAKKYMVSDANEIVVIKKQESDATILYLSYAKDRELIERGKNKYIIIKATELTKEVSELFTESDLIILN